MRKEGKASTGNKAMEDLVVVVVLGCLDASKEEGMTHAGLVGGNIRAAWFGK